MTSNALAADCDSVLAGGSDAGSSGIPGVALAVGAAVLVLLGAGVGLAIARRRRTA